MPANDRISGVQELADGVLVVPNQGVQLVPNVGVVEGGHSVLVVETGLGPRNAERVLAFAARGFRHTTPTSPAPAGWP